MWCIEEEGHGGAHAWCIEEQGHGGVHVCSGEHA